MNILRILLLTIACLITSIGSDAEKRLSIKYRATSVDVDKHYFEELDTSSSSFIKGAWYDASKHYMVIDLGGTNYHYCAMSPSTWNGFKAASSFGTFYNTSIKGNFDCRKYPAPTYEK